MANKGLIVVGALAVGWIAAAALLLKKAKSTPAPPPPASGKATLYGVARDSETGQAIIGTSLTLGDLPTATDSNGSYAFTNIEPGSYVLSATKNGYESYGPVSVTIVEGTNTLDIDMTPISKPAETLAYLYGAIINSSTGQGIGGASIILRNQPQVLADDQGNYSIANLEPGTYRYQVTQDGYEMATADVVLIAGENHLDVTLNPVPMPPLPPTVLELKYINPHIPGTSSWDVKLYDIATHVLEDSGITLLGNSVVLHPSSNSFMLYIGEWFITNSPQLGPYLVTVPGMGQYTFDGATNKINGIATIDMPNTPNECNIIGMLTQIRQVDISHGFRSMDAVVLVQDSSPISGQNWGAYFIGESIIVKGCILVDGNDSPFISTGRKIIVPVSLERGQYTAVWNPQGKMRYYPDYPSAQFSITTITEPERLKGSSCSGNYLFTVKGNVSQFALAFIEWNSHSGNPIIGSLSKQVKGPVTDYPMPYSQSFGSAGGSYQVCSVYAHPDPNRGFPMQPYISYCDVAAALDNWVKLFNM